MLRIDHRSSAVIVRRPVGQVPLTMRLIVQGSHRHSSTSRSRQDWSWYDLLYTLWHCYCEWRATQQLLYIPSFPKKLINVGDITAAGGSLTLSHDTNVLRYQGTEHKLTRVGKLWKLPQQEAHTEAHMTTDVEWHESARIETSNIEVSGRNDGWN